MYKYVNKILYKRMTFIHILGNTYNGSHENLSPSWQHNLEMSKYPSTWGLRTSPINIIGRDEFGQCNCTRTLLVVVSIFTWIWDLSNPCIMKSQV